MLRFAQHDKNDFFNTLLRHGFDEELTALRLSDFRTMRRTFSASRRDGGSKAKQTSFPAEAKNEFPITGRGMINKCGEWV